VTKQLEEEMWRRVTENMADGLPLAASNPDNFGVLLLTVLTPLESWAMEEISMI
jgi:hypothetical protein